MPDYVEYIKVGTGDEWPVRDAELHGFGLGGPGETKLWSEVDSLTNNGTYAFSGINQTINGIAVTSATMLVISLGPYYCTQILRTSETGSGSYVSYTLVRSRGYIGWTEWECPDPPLDDGVEYRTTRRYGGQVLYTKRINCGSMPASAATLTTNMGIQATKIVKLEVIAYSSSAMMQLPRVSSNSANLVDVFMSNANLLIVTNSGSYSGYAAVAQIWYYK